MAVSQPTLTGEAHSPAVCANCSQELLGDFCYHCGEQKHHEEELTLKHFFLHATHDLTHLDTKVFATLRYLFTRPGFLTQEFIAGRRTRYMRPFSLFLVACAIFFLADSIRPISGYDVHQLTAVDKSGRVGAAWDKLAQAKHVSREIVIDRVQETLHRGTTAAQIFNALALATMMAILFHKRYFIEHLVFSLHFLSFTYLGSVLLSPLNATPGSASIIVITLIFGAYLFVSMRRVYGQGTVATLLKTVIAYAFAQLVILVTLITVLVIAIVRAATAK